MTDIPDETLYDYFVDFCLEGAGRRFQYEVSKGSYDRIREALENTEIGNIVFEAYRPAKQIVVNTRFLQLAHFLWRPKQDEDLSSPTEQPADQGDTVDLYFIGKEDPVRLRADDPEEVFDLVLAMETEAFSRCSVVDANGEEAVLDIRKLVVAELPLGLAQQGETNALLELEEEV
jgi:hypothetical protein